MEMMILGEDIENKKNLGMRKKIEIGKIRVIKGKVFIFMGEIVIVVEIKMLMKKRKNGREIREVDKNRSEEELMGVNVQRI